MLLEPPEFRRAVPAPRQQGSEHGKVTFGDCISIVHRRWAGIPLDRVAAQRVGDAGSDESRRRREAETAHRHRPADRLGAENQADFGRRAQTNRLDDRTTVDVAIVDDHGAHADANPGEHSRSRTQGVAPGCLLNTRACLEGGSGVLEHRMDPVAVGSHNHPVVGLHR